MLRIDYKSQQAIYEQIIDGIKKLILNGVYQNDDKLPTVRQLAQDLAINPNTIQKAYAELERQGITYTVKGRGSFVASSLSELKAQQAADMVEELKKFSQECVQLGIAEELLHQIIQAVYEAKKQKGGTGNDSSAATQ